METLLRAGADKNTVLPPPQLPVRAISPRRSRMSALSMLPSLPVGEAKFQASASEKWGPFSFTQPPLVGWRLRLECAASENTGAPLALVLAHKVMLPWRRGQLGRWKSLPPRAQLLKREGHSEISGSIFPPSVPTALSAILLRGWESGHKIDSSFFAKELTSLVKFKPKDTQEQWRCWLKTVGRILVDSLDL